MVRLEQSELLFVISSIVIERVCCVGRVDMKFADGKVRIITIFSMTASSSLDCPRMILHTFRQPFHSYREFSLNRLT